MNVELWVNKALTNIGNVRSNSPFLLKDLFAATEWNQLTNGEKRDFGRIFRHKVDTGLVPNVTFYQKAQNGSALYIKERK